MPRYPTPSEYQEALQFPATAFTDAALQQAEPEADALGLPRAITGAFAAVFPVNLNGERYAVRCFLSEVPDQQARYRAIARHLASDEAEPLRPYVVPFEYVKDAVRVGGGTFPVLKMGWAEGVPLNRFVAEHLQQPAVLCQLADDVADMLEDLHTSGVAHGDLQHGNILVRAEGDRHRLILVDYDTMFVPALRGRKSPEVGHRNYQHPDRGPDDFGRWLDHFPGLVIYTALQACALDPELWERYDTGENLLFRAEDFFDPGASALFGELVAQRDIRPLAEALRAACFLEPVAVPSLADVRAGRTVSGRSRPRRRFGLPSGANTRTRRREHAERTVLERAFLPAAIGWAAMVITLFLIEWPVYAFTAAAVGTGAFGWTAGHAYRRHAVVRRRRRLSSEVAYFERVVRGLQQEIQVLEQEQAAIGTSIETLKAERLETLRSQALHDRLKHHFVAEVATFEGIHPRVVTRLKYHGIRNAFQATPDQLAHVSEMGAQTKTRVSLWRAGLVARYRNELPERLSPAEERRLERYVEQRSEALREEIARTRQKIEVQEQEREQVLARLAGLPPLGFGRYLRFLFHLGHVPPARSLQKAGAVRWLG